MLSGAAATENGMYFGALEIVFRLARKLIKIINVQSRVWG